MGCLRILRLACCATLAQQTTIVSRASKQIIYLWDYVYLIFDI